MENEESVLAVLRCQVENSLGCLETVLVLAEVGDDICLGKEGRAGTYYSFGYFSFVSINICSKSFLISFLPKPLRLANIPLSRSSISGFTGLGTKGRYFKNGIWACTSIVCSCLAKISFKCVLFVFVRFQDSPKTVAVRTSWLCVRS